MIDWPADLLPMSGAYAQAIRSLSGGQSLSGFEQVQPQFQDRWAASFTFLVRDVSAIRSMRAILSQLRGRAGTVRLPEFEKGRAPFRASVSNPPFFKRFAQFAGLPHEWSAIAAVTGTASITAADRMNFVSTGAVPPATGMWVTLAGVKRRLINVAGASSPYDCTFKPSLAGSVGAPAIITATLAASAALRATSVDLFFATGGPPVPGHRFSIGDRLYQVDTVAALGSETYRLGIWPWLRAAALSSAAANFTTPRCEMRLATDDEGQDAMRALELRRRGPVPLQFNEAAAT